MSWFAPTSKAASSGLQTSAIGSPGGLSLGDLTSALQSNPLLSSISPSQVTGASAPSQPGLMSKLGGLASSAAGAALAPATGGVSAFLPMVTGLFGGGSAPPPMQFPTLQHSEGQIAPPVTSPSVGNSGPLTGGPSGITGLNPQLMRLIQMLQGGGGPSGIA